MVFSDHSIGFPKDHFLGAFAKEIRAIGPEYFRANETGNLYVYLVVEDGEIDLDALKVKGEDLGIISFSEQVLNPKDLHDNLYTVLPKKKIYVGITFILYPEKNKILIKPIG